MTDQSLETISTSGVESAPPQTPERGRVLSRYPSHLSREVDSEGKPRPLLHRRGTSHTYETLEDLLKEAGYKETRIFTPEVDRREADGEEGEDVQRKGSEGGVGGAVVKLFSSWLSTTKRTGADDVRDEQVRRPHPPSPLAHRTRGRLSNASTLRMPSPPRSSSSSMVTVRPNYRPPSLSLLQHQHSLTRQSSSRSAFTSASTSTSSLNPHSRARIALRHAASAPHIDKRRTRTQPRASRANKPKAPPLPVTWLETISAALRSPGSSSPPPSPTSALRKPPFLTQPAHTSPGIVTITNVVCRSAPSSRSSSTVRPAKRKPSVLVPSLAQTSVCEELAPAPWPPHSPHHLPQEDSALMDDDDDEELNLQMILVPSKRQHSIRSLRSVLQQQNSFPSSSSMAIAQEEYARMVRRRIDAAENLPEPEPVDAEGQGHWDSGEFLTARVKRRRSNLPRNWGWAS